MPHLCMSLSANAPYEKWPICTYGSPFCIEAERKCALAKVSIKEHVREQDQNTSGTHRHAKDTFIHYSDSLL